MELATKLNRFYLHAAKTSKPSLALIKPRYFLVHPNKQIPQKVEKNMPQSEKCLLKQLNSLNYFES